MVTMKRSLKLAIQVIALALVLSGCGLTALLDVGEVILMVSAPFLGGCLRLSVGGLSLPLGTLNLVFGTDPVTLKGSGFGEELLSLSD